MTLGKQIDALTYKLNAIFLTPMFVMASPVLLS